MLLRRAFFLWLLPAAFLLPLWLLLGWGIFTAGGIAFLWTLFIAIPSVFVGQLVFTLLVRARPTVRAARAVSWWDVLGFGVWHALTIAVGVFDPAWFAPVLVLAILAAIGLLWLLLWQLFRESRGAFRQVVLRTDGSQPYIPPQRPRETTTPVDDVFIVTEESRERMRRTQTPPE